MVQALAFFVISTVVSGAISYLFPSEGPRLKDLSVSSSAYGNIIPEVFGTARVAGNMIWSSGIAEKKKKNKAGLGSFYNSYSYSANFAMAFCKGPGLLRRIWANGKIIYDATGESAQTTTGKYAIRFYSGGEDQLPDPLIQADKGAANTPAYRGLCYVVFEDFALDDFGQQLPQMAAEMYSGAGDGIPIIDMVPMVGGTLNELRTLRIDHERGYIYSNHTFNAGFRRFRLSDGVEDRQILDGEMGLFSTNVGDNGRYQALQGVASDGAVIVSQGNGNYMKLVVLDGNSYTHRSSVGTAQPTGGALDVGTLHANITNDRFLSIGLFGNVDYLTYTTNLLTGLGELAISPGEVIFGDQHTSRAVAANDTGEFYLMWGGGLFGPEDMPLIKIQPGGFGLGGEGASEVYALENPHPGSIAKVSCMAWDFGSPGLLIFHLSGSRKYITKWSPDTGLIIWQTELPTDAHFPVKQFTVGRVTNGMVAWTASTKLWIVNTLNGTFVDRSIDTEFYLTDNDTLLESVLRVNAGVAGYSIGFQPDDYQWFDGATGILVSTSGGTGEGVIININAFAAEPVTVGYIVERLLRQGGMTSTDMDLGPLYDIEVIGYGFATNTDIKSIINELRQIYLFDLVESNGKIVASLRGGDVSDETISYLALGSTTGDDENQSNYWKETRASEADLPSEVSLVYMDAENDFQPGTARSMRIRNPIPTMFSRQQAILEASIALTPTEAKNRTNSMLYVQWGERTKHATKLPWAYAYLDPSDKITMNGRDGRTYFERIESTEMGADLSIDAETRGQDSGAYTQDVVADGGGEDPQTVLVPSPAKAFVINSPYLRDLDAFGDGTFSIYYAGTGNDGTGTFHGAHLFLSRDQSTYSEVAEEDRSVEWGTVVGIVPPPSHGCYGLDWEAELIVWPATPNFTLESIDYDTLWAGGNPCVIGNEVIQFMDAEDNGDGSWTIRNLLRGRRGTEWAADTHVYGESIVFLDAETIDILQESLDSAGTLLFFKAVGIGKSLSSTLTLKITYEPRDLMPYAVADIKREIDGSDAVLTWARRTRLGGNLLDGTGTVPLSETAELYETYILDAPFDGDLSKPDAPEDFVRMHTTSTPEATYTAAEMSTDGFTLASDTLHVVIYQVSGAVGRGFPRPRSIEASAID